MEALPSFLGHKDVVVDVPGLGKVSLQSFFTAHIPDNLVQVTMDLAFGGMWFAIVAADQVAYKLGSNTDLRWS